MATVTLVMPFDSPSPPDGQPPRSPRPGTNIKGERAIDPSPLSCVLATRLVVPAPWTEERRAEPQADTQPRPIPVVIVPGVPPTSPCVRTHQPDVTRRRRRGVGRDVVIEVLPGAPHPLHEVRQAGFWIGAYGFPAERLVVPVPVLLELGELERRPGEGGTHGSVAGGVVPHEGLSAAASLQLVLLAATDLLIAVGINRKQHAHLPARVGAQHHEIAVLGGFGVDLRQ